VIIEGLLLSINFNSLNPGRVKYSYLKDLIMGARLQQGSIKEQITLELENLIVDIAYTSLSLKMIWN
jgi:hypothetical protein